MNCWPFVEITDYYFTGNDGGGGRLIPRPFLLVIVGLENPGKTDLNNCGKNLH